MDPLWSGDPCQVGPFSLRGRLGAGGMGEVFLGESPGGRAVVVKLIRADRVHEPAYRRRFARASRLISKAFPTIQRPSI